MATRGTQANLSNGPREPPVKKRLQVTVACNECRTRKVKCDGARPICQHCNKRQSTCTYAADPDAPPMVALKRKHDALQRQSADEHEILSRLRSVSQLDAQKILELLRGGENMASTLQFARALSTPGAAAENVLATYRDQNTSSGSLTSVPYGGYSSHASIALDLNSGRDRLDRVVRRRPNDATGSAVPTLPSFKSLIASIGDHANIPPEGKTRITRSPSAPNLQPVDASRSRPSPSRLTWRHDDRLNHAIASDWDITYVDDDTFRNIVCTYLIWDHPSTRLFDEDDFLDGLMNMPSESCSKCLVHVVVAYGAINYAHVDAEMAAKAHKAAFSELHKIWDTETNGDDKIANAAAGLLAWSLHGVLGADKLGLPYLLQARHMAVNIGLYSKESVPRVYDTSRPQRTRARAVFAWGFFSYLALIELTHRANLGLPDPPPIEVPCVMNGSYYPDKWLPWPWPRTGRSVAALIDETLTTRAVLFTIVNEIPPLQRRHSGTDLTSSYLEASLAIYRRLSDCWNSMSSAIRELDEATPHVLFLNCAYNFAIAELFRPFTTTPMHPSPHAKPLTKANLPAEPTTSAAIAAAQRLRDVLACFALLYADIQAPVFFMQFAMAVAFETLPSASPLSLNFSSNAGNSFINALRILHRGSKSWPVIRFAALSIEQAASQMHIPLPYEAEEIFTDLKHEIATSESKVKIRAGWIVDLRTAGTDVQGARLDNLIKELDKLGIGGR